MPKKTKAAPAAIPRPEIHADHDLSALVEHPDNPRTISRDGERDLSDSIDEFGMVETIVANRRADGSLVVISGHQRLRVLRKKGIATGPVTVIQVDEAAEHKLLLRMNGHDGRFDGDKLETLMARIRSEGNGDVLSHLGLGGNAAFDAIMVTQANLDEAMDRANEAASGSTGDGAREVDVDGIEMAHRCPRCGFEYNEDTDRNGARGQTRSDKFDREAPPADDEGDDPEAEEPEDP